MSALLALLLLQVVPLLPPPGPPVELPPARSGWCADMRITGYVRTDPYMNPMTADGTSIFTAEPIVAASPEIPLGSYVWIEGLGTFRVADRGGGVRWRHIDVAVWSRAEAFDLTGYRTVCVEEW
jgi:3D (Asp-Asp-Asp) domain-containing protein